MGKFLIAVALIVVSTVAYFGYKYSSEIAVISETMEKAQKLSKDVSDPQAVDKHMKALEAMIQEHDKKGEDLDCPKFTADVQRYSQSLSNPAHRSDLVKVMEFHLGLFAQMEEAFKDRAPSSKEFSNEMKSFQDCYESAKNSISI